MLKKLINGPNNSILSAATVIMVMIVASRILGLVRQRVLAHFFPPGELSLFFAAFRLPDLVFEVLVFGTLTSAFIPVFTKYLERDEKAAWKTAGKTVSIGLVSFAFFAVVFGLLAHLVYSLVAPGFSPSEVGRIASLARILFAAQGFFVISYVLTGVLESQRRFLIPALAPVFYNIGIILGTILFAGRFGLFAPTLGVVIGAMSHFLIQLPQARKLGFRFVFSLKPDSGVKRIGRLAAPRIADLSFQQVAKTVELSLSSIISTASYTYITFANSLQLLPVSLFGISLAKAALPTLARQADDLESFRNTIFKTFYQIVFLTLPLAIILIVLRIPIVRLTFGTGIFDWEATVQTGMILTAFAVGIPFQAAVALLARGFYALHDTKTPMLISIGGVAINITANFALVKALALPTWAIGAAFSLGVAVQLIILLVVIAKRLKVRSFFAVLVPLYKSIAAALISGVVMFFLLKIFDRATWVKRISFLGKLDLAIPFERFVIDTRYTFNLLILTIFVAAIGGLVYLSLSFVFRSRELAAIGRLIKKRRFTALPEEPEPIST